MNKRISFIISIIIFAVLAGIFPTKITADDTLKIAGVSGTPLASVKVQAKDYRADKLRAFFKKYNSPLVEYSDEFVFYADKYNIDYRLVPAISGVESTFGQALPANSYNAYGWNGGAFYFKDWEDGIATVSQTLRENYMDKWHAENVSAIGRIYAPPSTTWAGKVQYFMQKIDETKVTDSHLVTLTI